MEDQLRKVEAKVQSNIENIQTKLQEFKLQVDSRFIEMDQKLDAFMAGMDTKLTVFLQAFIRERNTVTEETQSIKKTPLLPIPNLRGWDDGE